eukprot:5626235-Lingulodinium_polyedra.AAC.1
MRELRPSDTANGGCKLVSAHGVDVWLKEKRNHPGHIPLATGVECGIRRCYSQAVRIRTSDS